MKELEGSYRGCGAGLAGAQGKECAEHGLHARTGVLALIDRNFQGFGKELFTDAGKYVIHFGSKPSDAAEQVRLLLFTAAPSLCQHTVAWPWASINVTECAKGAIQRA